MKKIKLTLVGLNSNIYNLLGAFCKQAKREGWSEKEIENITKLVTSSESYEAALNVLASRCNEPEEDAIDW